MEFVSSGSPLPELGSHGHHRHVPSYTSLQLSGSSQSLFLMDDIVEERVRSYSSATAIPCPRLFGAVFGWNGRLVVFNNLTRFQDVSNTAVTLPRTYRDLRSALDCGLEDIDDDDPHQDMFAGLTAPSSTPATLSVDLFAVDDLPAADEYFRAFYQNEYHGDFQHQRYREDTVGFESSSDDASPAPTRDSPCTTIMISSLPTLFPLSAQLASQYSLCGPSAAAICKANAAKARAAQHNLHAWAWEVAANVCKVWDSEHAARAWRYHAFGGRLAQRLTQQFVTLNDIQLAALLSSVFKLPVSRGGFDESFLLDTTTHPADNARESDKLALQYAEMLARLGLLSSRAELLSFVRADPAQVEDAKVQFPLEDTICCVCRTKVKGAMHFCKSCLHGGHRNHMLEWFRSDSECPSGCGCLCRA